jgi:DNA-binding NtrC family response regulator
MTAYPFDFKAMCRPTQVALYLGQNASTMSTLGTWLRDNGMALDTADSFEGMTALCRRQRYACFFMETDQDGAEWLAAGNLAHSRSTAEAARVVLLATDPSPAQYLKARFMGFTGVLTVPLKVEALQQWACPTAEESWPPRRMVYGFDAASSFRGAPVLR